VQATVSNDGYESKPQVKQSGRPMSWAIQNHVAGMLCRMDRDSIAL